MSTQAFISVAVSTTEIASRVLTSSAGAITITPREPLPAIASRRQVEAKSLYLTNFETPILR